MSYVVQRVEDQKNSFVINETDTGTQIKLKHPEKNVNIIARKLNLGSGFEGWTPIFFAELL